MDGRGRRGRRDARGLIALAIPYGLVVLYALASSGFMDPTFGLGPPWYVRALPILGPVTYFVGLAWMIRIYRAARPEPGERSWRYRDV